MLSFLILYNNNEPFLDWIVMCNKQLILHNWWWPVQWLDRKEAPKHFPEPYLNQKKVMVTVGWSRLTHYSFLNPGEIISEKYAQQISEMHQKLQCLQPAVVNRKGLILFHDNTQLHVTLNEHFKSWKYWATKFCCIHHIHLTSLPTDYNFFKHLDNFLQGRRFHNQQETESAFQELIESHSTDFLRYKNKETYFLLAKMCWF